MTSRNRRRSFKTKRRTVTVSIKVPRRVYMNTPSILNAPPVNPRHSERRHSTVPLHKPRGKLYTKRYRINLPNNHPLTKPSYSMIDRNGNLRQFSQRKTRKLLKREYNRKRYRERKPERTRYSRGYLSSVRTDPFGVIGSNVSGTPNKIEDSALASQALINTLIRRR